MIEATNQQSKVTRDYDDLGRLTNEGQWIRLDGDVSGSFKHEVDANYSSYDLDSQLLSMNMSGNGGAEDLKVDATYTRERPQTRHARAFAAERAYSRPLVGLASFAKAAHGPSLPSLGVTENA